MEYETRSICDDVGAVSTLNHEKKMTQTWNQFLTVSVENGENTNVIEWNSLESYRNTSPGTALKRHKELFPSSKVKVISF
jgi:hypothetical protein